MFRAIRRWLLREHAAEAGCVEREIRQRQELQAGVDRQLAELIAYLDRATNGPPRNDHHGASS